VRVSVPGTHSPAFSSSMVSVVPVAAVARSVPSQPDVGAFQLPTDSPAVSSTRTSCSLRRPGTLGTMCPDQVPANAAGIVTALPSGSARPEGSSDHAGDLRSAGAVSRGPPDGPAVAVAADVSPATGVPPSGRRVSQATVPALTSRAAT